MPIIVLRRNALSDPRPKQAYKPAFVPERPEDIRKPLEELRKYLKPDKIGRHADAVRELLDGGNTDLSDIPSAEGRKQPSRVRSDLRKLFSRYERINHRGDKFWIIPAGDDGGAHQRGHHEVRKGEPKP